MSLRNLVKPGHQGKFEAHADEIIPMLLNGVPQREVAAKFGGTLQGLQLFATRHQQEIDALRTEARQLAATNWIAQKEKRLDVLRELTEAELGIFRTRGLEPEDVKLAANGDTVSVKYFDKALASEIRAALDDAAAEMGERQKAPVIDARSQTVNLFSMLGSLSE